MTKLKTSDALRLIIDYCWMTLGDFERHLRNHGEPAGTATEVVKIVKAEMETRRAFENGDTGAGS